MNFELANKLRVLLAAKKLTEAIGLAETALMNIPQTGFHQIIGANLLHLVSELRSYISDFEESTTAVLQKKNGVIKQFFASKKESRPAAFYCEMNGFTINYDRWFIDLFSFERFYLEGWDWISDFYDSTGEDMTITGFESIQNVFQYVHENDMFKEPNIYSSYEVCELLVILRLQELFKETYKNTTDAWAQIPMFVSAHDYELIYRPN